MKLGALLVLIGTILVFVDLCLVRAPHPHKVVGLLHVGIILIGAGVLAGHTILVVH